MTLMTRKAFYDACAQLAPLLTPYCSDRLAHFYDPEGTVEAALGQAVSNILGTTAGLFVPDIAALVAMTQPVFSSGFRAHILSSVDNFDSFTGMDDAHVSRRMLKCADAAYWLRTIVHAMALAAVEVPFGRTDKEQLLEITTPKRTTKQTKKAPSSCVKNIDLCGTTVKDAWYRNDELHRYEQAAHRFARAIPTWTPEFPRNKLPVFCSAPAPMADAHQSESDVDDTLQRPLVPEARAHPAVPAGLPVVWTAYSPLRQYLWALFHETLTNMDLGGTKRPMDVHSGTALFVIGPDALKTTPHIYTVPRECTAHWMQFKRQHPSVDVDSLRSESPRALWRRYAAQRAYQALNDKQKLQDWPWALHLADVDEYLMGAQNFQTAWHGGGVERLNAATRSLMSIRLELEADGPTDEERDRRIQEREEAAMAAARLRETRAAKVEAKTARRRVRTARFVKHARAVEKYAGKLLRKLFVPSHSGVGRKGY